MSDESSALAAKVGADLVAPDDWQPAESSGTTGGVGSFSSLAGGPGTMQ